MEASEGKRKALIAMRATAKQEEEEEVKASEGKRHMILPQALGTTQVTAKIPRDAKGSDTEWGRHTDNADRAVRGIQSWHGKAYTGSQRPGRVSVHDPQPW